MDTFTPQATTIMIIRHGEKPPDSPAKSPPFGVTPHGIQDEHSLSVRGWQRAGALVTLFTTDASRLHTPLLSTPDIIYAIKKEGHGKKAHDPDGSHGKRTQQTVRPLAEKLGERVSLNTTFDKGDEKDMITSAMQCSGVVLICWEHHHIPLIAKHMPIAPSTPVPSEWPPGIDGLGRFDLVWVFSYQEDSGVYQFRPMAQLLLAGDMPV